MLMVGLSVVSQRESVKNDKPTISMSLSHCIHQTLNSNASTRFHSGVLHLSLHVALPICRCRRRASSRLCPSSLEWSSPSAGTSRRRRRSRRWTRRSEEHTSELQSHSDLVCRLLLEKKKNAE